MASSNRIFDKFSKILQLNRNIRRNEYKNASYLAEHVTESLLERWHEIREPPTNPVVIGSRNIIQKQFFVGGSPVFIDSSEVSIIRQASERAINSNFIVCEDEWMPFKRKTFDGAMSVLHVHWIENLKEFGTHLNRSLKPNSPFLGALIGQNSLLELRMAVEKAGSLIESGFRARFSPLIGSEDVGRFLSESNFKSITVDSEQITINYPSLADVLKDLRLLGASNALFNRNGGFSSRLFKSTEDEYNKICRDSGNRDLPLTFSGSMETAIQIVDQNKLFKLEDLEHFVKRSHAAASSQSPIIAVFGSQSSGKSTLLNHLFDTKFDVMAYERREQTTHGIWLAVEPKAHFVILDIEGTDGRERGEDKDFERKSALFVLAVADVLIVNIWENTIGLYNASNINLLKTVVDVYLEIYPNLIDTTKTILFVIRDYVGATPKHELSKILSEEFIKIWDSIQKPPTLDSRELADLFSLQFAFLPHKVFKADDFLSAVDNLRDKFFSTNNEETVFLNATQNGIVLSDFPLYASSIWETISANKSLDLPTQQDLLAQHRADEAISLIISDLKRSNNNILSLINNDELEKAKLHLKSLINDAFKTYNENTARYSKSIVDARGSELTDRIHEFVDVIFRRFCQKAEVKALDLFELELNLGEKQGLTEEQLESAVQRSSLFFRATIEDFTKIDKKLLFEDQLTSFQKLVVKRGKGKVDAFLSKESKLIKKRFKSSTRSVINDSLASSGVDVWQVVDEQFLAEIQTALGSFEVAQKSFPNSSDTEEVRLQLVEELLNEFRDLLLNEASKSILKIFSSKAFEKGFRYDPSGRPRHWSSLQEIDEEFDKAYTKATKFIESIKVYRPSEGFLLRFPNFEKEVCLIDEKTKLELLESMKRDAEGMFLEAKRSLISGSTSIPAWIIIVIIILGWNEFMAIISSPLYLFLAILILACAFLVHQLRLTGPIRTAISVIGELLTTPVGPPQSVDSSESKHKSD